MTIFDVIQIAAIIGGGFLGMRLGALSGNVMLVIAGSIAGLTVGWIIGRLPLLLSLYLLDSTMKRTSTDALRTRLKTQYFISHHLIAELLRRGEPLESVRAIVEQQLASPSPDVQRFGRANARLWFPQLLSDELKRFESSSL